MTVENLPSNHPRCYESISSMKNRSRCPTATVVDVAIDTADTKESNPDAGDGTSHEQTQDSSDSMPLIPHNRQSLQQQHLQKLDIRHRHTKIRLNNAMLKLMIFLAGITTIHIITLSNPSTKSFLPNKSENTKIEMRLSSLLPPSAKQDSQSYSQRQLSVNDRNRPASLRSNDSYSSNTTSILELAKSFVEPSRSNITAAICYKTLFGNIDVRLVLQWVSFHRLLGFDHFFFFYRTNEFFDDNLLYFRILRNLPFVTMKHWTRGNRNDYYDQRGSEDFCLKSLARNYSWVLTADIDEYLRLPNGMGIKDFLSLYDDKYDYLSFGKFLYTLDHRVEAKIDKFTKYLIRNDATTLEMDMHYKLQVDDHEFVFTRYPFYMKYFCYHYGKGRTRNLGDPICPIWKGRAKVMVKPAIYSHINVHGVYTFPEDVPTAEHFHPDYVHLMEWPHIFSEHNVSLHYLYRSRNVTKTAIPPFTISSEDDVHIHNLEKGFQKNAYGNYTVYYDDELVEYFEFVKNRGRKDPPMASKSSVATSFLKRSGR